MKSFLHKLSVFCALYILLLLAGCATIPQDQQKEADFHYKMGISYLNEGNIQMAFAQLQKALQLDQYNKEILNSLGFVYMQLEEYENAKDLFLRAIAVDHQFSDAYNNLGVTYIKTGHWRKAVESFMKALSNPLYQTPGRAFYNLGVSYYKLGQFELAIDAFKDSIKRTPSSPLPYYGLALAYNKVGRYGDAASVIARAIELDTAYKGDRTKFINDIKQKIVTTRDEEETEFKDYLEIMMY